MDSNSLRWRRVIHMIIISLFIVILLLEGVREVIPRWDIVLAIGFVLVWMMGIRYERQVILESGLVEKDELKEAEMVGYRWINWGGGKE